MEQYSILLPNEKVKTYRYFSLFILLMNAFLFGIIFLYSVEAFARALNIAGFVMSIVFFALLMYKIRKKPGFIFNSSYAFVLISLDWFFQLYFLPGMAMLLLAAISYISEREHRIFFNAETIIYPSFPKKTFTWKELNNVILKDGVLTIDFSNNRIIQAVIVPETANVIDETAFNGFCRRMLIV